MAETSSTITIYDYVSTGQSWFLEVTSGEIISIDSSGVINGTTWTANLWTFSSGTWSQVATLNTDEVDTGIDYEITTISQIPVSSVESFVNYVSPPLNIGDEIMYSATTSPGGYNFVVREDGTFYYNASGDISRQSIKLNAYRTSSQEYAGEITFYINNKKPVFNNGSTDPVRFTVNSGDEFDRNISAYLQDEENEFLDIIVSPSSKNLPSDFFENFGITVIDNQQSTGEEPEELLESGYSYYLTGIVKNVTTTAEITFRIIDTVGEYTEGTFIFTIQGTPEVINPSGLTNIQLTENQYSSYNLAQYFSPGTYTWVMTGNSPPGMTLNRTTGVFSGTPNTFGDYEFSIVATSSNNLSAVGRASATVLQETSENPSFTLNSTSYIPGTIATLTFSRTPTTPPKTVKIKGVEVEFYEPPSGNIAKIKIPTVSQFVSGDYKTLPWNRFMTIEANFDSGSSSSLIQISGPLGSNRAGSRYWYGVTPENPNGIFKELEPGTFWFLDASSGRIESITSDGRIISSQTGSMKAWVFPGE
jgi:hypothetical protein